MDAEVEVVSPPPTTLELKQQFFSVPTSKHSTEDLKRFRDAQDGFFLAGLSRNAEALVNSILHSRGEE